MEDLKDKIICECGEATIIGAVIVFQETTLPYKKAKKLVTKCNKTCCRKPLTALFNMVEFGKVDYEEIDYLIELTKGR